MTKREFLAASVSETIVRARGARYRMDEWKRLAAWHAFTGYNNAKAKNPTKYIELLRQLGVERRKTLKEARREAMDILHEQMAAGTIKGVHGTLRAA